MKTKEGGEKYLKATKIILAAEVTQMQNGDRKKTKSKSSAHQLEAQKNTMKKGNSGI